MTVKISVIIPAYNQAIFLGEAIYSVLNQSFQDFEIIVIDDGSTDNTPDVVNSFSDERILYLYQKNLGVSAARNSGIRISNGSYICFLDADDKFIENKLKLQDRFLDNNPDVGMVVSGYRFIDSDSDVIREMNSWEITPKLDIDSLLYICPFTPNSYLIRRFWVEESEGFDEQFRGLEDWDFYLRLVNNGCNIAWLERIVCDYRIHHDNMSQSPNSPIYGFIPILDKFFSNSHLPINVLNQKKEAYIQAYFRTYTLASRKGNWDDAFYNITQAISNDSGLKDNNYQQIFERIVSSAQDPFVDDHFEYINRAFENIPEPIIELRKRKREAISYIEFRELINAFKRNQKTEVYKAFFRSIIYNPRLIFNRGVISIISKTLLTEFDFRK